MTVLKCDRCRLRIDPVAAPTHPCCENTPSARLIRSHHYLAWMREPPKPRRPRLARHNPDLEKL